MTGRGSEGKISAADQAHNVLDRKQICDRRSRDFKYAFLPDGTMLED
jgi:hypothetical protein